jgi:hypothetical protein
MALASAQLIKGRFRSGYDRRHDPGWNCWLFARGAVEGCCWRTPRVADIVNFQAWMTSVAKFSESKYKAYMAAATVTYHLTLGVNYSEEFLVKSYRLVHRHAFPTQAKYSICYDFHVAFKIIISWGPIDRMSFEQLRTAAMYMVKLDIIGRGICLRGMLWEESKLVDKKGEEVRALRAHTHVQVTIGISL